MKNYLFRNLQIIAMALMLAGCAGYNTTVFTTKSNAGLDLEVKPTPTAEISISRKEAVVEPGFEKGQTLPVMASYKPRVGFFGGFENYFVGVDQTFAGGDSALTMAQLYDAPTDKGDATKYDSAFTITDNQLTNSSWSRFWNRLKGTPIVALSKPGEYRPFIFTTDTMLGLKVAWNGETGEFPDSLKAGFNRKEFAWAPVTVDSNQSVKMPSFLATIESRIGGGITNQTGVTNALGSAGAGVSAIQYFATGKAATYLALQKDVRDAMLSRLDPTYKHKGIQNSVVLRQVLASMYNAYGQMPGDDNAVFHEKKLSNLKGITVPESFEANQPPMAYCTYDSNSNILNNVIHNASYNTTNLTIPTVTAYMAALEHSISALDQAGKHISNLTLVVLNQGTNASTDNGVITNINQVASQLVLQTQVQQKLQQDVAANEDISEALHYYNFLTRQ